MFVDGEDRAVEKQAVAKASDEECSEQSTGSGSENGASPTPDGSLQSATVNKNGKPKSAISQIHECALQMRMNVEFEVFIVLCEAELDFSSPHSFFLPLPVPSSLILSLSLCS